MPLTVDQDDRTRFIGGSDIAAILGLSRYSTPLSVWAEKTGLVVNEIGPEPLHLILGKRLEEVIAEIFTQQTGLRVQRMTERRVHPKFPHFQAQIDRLIVGTGELLECKTASAYLSKDWIDDQIPQEYICQVMWQMAVTGRKRAHIAALIGNQEFKIKTIDRDPVMIAEMIKRANAFWNDFVIPRVMPGQITANDADTLFALFPDSDPAAKLSLGDDVAQLIETRNSFYQDQIHLEKQIEQIENEIKAKMTTAESATAGKWLVSWKTQKTRRIDTVLLKNTEPDIYKRYSKECPSRVFRIKEAKGETNGNH